MEKSFKLEGIAEAATGFIIVDNVKKIKGVENAVFTQASGELKVTLARPNALIGKLIEHVVMKEDSGIKMSEI